MSRTRSGRLLFVPSLPAENADLPLFSNTKIVLYRSTERLELHRAQALALALSRLTVGAAVRLLPFLGGSGACSMCRSITSTTLVPYDVATTSTSFAL